MSDDAYQQLENQRELARAQRRFHGSSTELDVAEDRFEVIAYRVYLVRRAAPVIVSLLIGWFGSPLPMQAWMFSFIFAYGSMLIAGFFGAIMGKVSGKIKPGIKTATEDLWYRILGVVVIVLGITGPSVGMVITGLALALMPTVWGRWSKRVFYKSDFMRLRREHRPAPAPRIME